MTGACRCSAPTASNYPATACERTARPGAYDVADIKSVHTAGFTLECLAGLVGIRGLDCCSGARPRAQQRWPDGPYCPRCGECEAVMRLQGKSTAPGLCICKSCRTKFSVTMGTIFERSHVGLAKWMLAFRLMAPSKKGMSALQLERTLGVTYKLSLIHI